MLARDFVRAALLALGLVLAIGARSAVAAPDRDPLALVDDLGANDRAVVERAVAEIERQASAPGAPREYADALFQAAKACEDTLADPARALALYELIVRDFADTRSAGSARRKVDILRARIGEGGAHAREAHELAQLIAEIDRLEPQNVERRARALIDADWPGASDAALWLAEWLRRTGRFVEAQAQYAEVARRWPDSPAHVRAIRGGAGNAIDAHDWDLAEQLANQLPAETPADKIVRDDLVRLARRGRSIGRWYTIAWIAAALGFAALLASLVEAAARGGWQRPRLRPPIEVAYLAPIATVLVGVALTAHQLIAPAVTILAVGGIALAWISGAALDTLRSRHRPVRARALAHVAICILVVVALAYVAVVRDNLFEMLIETVKFGPE